MRISMVVVRSAISSMNLIKYQSGARGPTPPNKSVELTGLHRRNFVVAVQYWIVFGAVRCVINNRPTTHFIVM